MTPKILIIGSTGKLGSKLLSYCYKYKIKISCITSFSNKRKMKNQSLKHSITNSFSLNNNSEYLNFLKFINKNHFKIIYFLDYGSNSLEYLHILLKKNRGAIFGIANKELIVAGGPILRKEFEISKNILLPLDSEHFSLFRNNPSNDEIKKIYITASGGPFYFKKKINLDHVNLRSVLKHPKWEMGINNSIDSSNFINKILEIFELSSIYKIELSKIDFLISREAYLHSIICYKDSTVNINCFKNDMLITLIKPLEFFFPTANLPFMQKDIMNISNFNLINFDDRRFKIFKYYKKACRFVKQHC